MKIESLNNISNLEKLESENTKKLKKEVKLYMDYYSLHEQGVIMGKFKVVYSIDRSIKQSSEVKSPEYLAGSKAFEEKKYALGMDLWIKLLAKGSRTAMYVIGLLYFNGQGVTQDYSKAMEWYLKAGVGYIASYGGKSQSAIGFMYYNGQGVTKDYVKAKEWFEKSFLRGKESLKMTATIYGKGGYGIEREKELAVKYKELYDKETR